MSNDKAEATYHGRPLSECQRAKAEQIHAAHNWEAELNEPKGKVRCPGYPSDFTGVRTESDRNANKPAELGPVGRWAIGIVALAIVTPFVGILWAWAAGVVRSMGGLW